MSILFILFESRLISVRVLSFALFLRSLQKPKTLEKHTHTNTYSLWYNYKPLQAFGKSEGKCRNKIRGKANCNECPVFSLFFSLFLETFNSPEVSVLVQQPDSCWDILLQKTLPENTCARQSYAWMCTGPLCMADQPRFLLRVECAC